MGVPPRKRGLSAKQRRALAMLADAGQNGVTEAILMANGFKPLMLAHLDRKGLAAAMIGETTKAGAKSVEIVRIRITAAGRKAIEG